MKLRLSAAPRTAYLARGPASRARRQLPQAILVEDLRPELLRLGQFRARGVARDHVVGLLRDRARDLAAGALDETLGLASCEVGQGAREHEGLAVERPALGTALGLVELEAQASLAQALHQPLRGLLGELLLDLRRGYRPDAPARGTGPRTARAGGAARARGGASPAAAWPPRRAPPGSAPRLSAGRPRPPRSPPHRRPSARPSCRSAPPAPAQ